MRKQKRWVIIPVTTAVLLALAGCGGQDTTTSAAEQTPSTTAGEQVGSGNNSTNPATSQGDAGEQPVTILLLVEMLLLHLIQKHQERRLEVQGLHSTKLALAM